MVLVVSASWGWRNWPARGPSELIVIRVRDKSNSLIKIEDNLNSSSQIAGFGHCPMLGQRARFTSLIVIVRFTDLISIYFVLPGFLRLTSECSFQSPPDKLHVT